MDLCQRTKTTRELKEKVPTEVDVYISKTINFCDYLIRGDYKLYVIKAGNSNKTILNYRLRLKDSTEHDLVRIVNAKVKERILVGATEAGKK